MDTTMPIIAFNYNLADVASAIGSNFSSIWLIIAFSVGIGLAFRFAKEIRGLFE